MGMCCYFSLELNGLILENILMKYEPINGKERLFCLIGFMA